MKQILRATGRLCADLNAVSVTTARSLLRSRRPVR